MFPASPRSLNLRDITLSEGQLMIYLYADNTPESFKVTITLEELGLKYQLEDIDVKQPPPAFMELSPRGRIPLLIDDYSGVCLQETSVILFYLASKADSLLPRHQGNWAILNELAAHTADIPPVLQQWRYFAHEDTSRNTEAIEHFRSMANTRLHALDRRLREQPYLMGEHYTIVDIANFAWTHGIQLLGFDFSHFKDLSDWHQRVATRPAVQRGLVLPAPAFAH
ncbi:glutathione S-transferase family protein [Pseudomonas sp. 210_17 TE3656]